MNFMALTARPIHPGITVRPVEQITLNLDCIIWVEWNVDQACNAKLVLRGAKWLLEDMDQINELAERLAEAQVWRR